MQSTACNAVHSVEQRLSRWLLLAHDRVGKDEFPLTQEFAAMMLGAARPTVTVVAGLASTIFLPTTQVLTATLGWRDALLVLSGMCLVVVNIPGADVLVVILPELGVQLLILNV